jgi:hypothetical protein
VSQLRRRTVAREPYSRMSRIELLRYLTPAQRREYWDWIAFENFRLAARDDRRRRRRAALADRIATDRAPKLERLDLVREIAATIRDRRISLFEASGMAGITRRQMRRVIRGLPKDVEYLSRALTAIRSGQRA